jgi:hypothetical protein
MSTPEPVRRLLSPDERQSLLNFVRWGLGDWRLRPWEEKFLSDRHQELYGEAVWMTDPREVKVQEIKDKLGHGRGAAPPAPPDPDGDDDNDDPDGWPPMRDGAGDPLEDDE